MRKNISVVYQFLLSIKIRNSYIDTILISIFFIELHLYILMDILRLGFNIKDFIGIEGHIGISAIISIIILIFYSKRSLLEIQYSKKVQAQKIKVIASYLFFLVLISVILSYL